MSSFVSEFTESDSVIDDNTRKQERYVRQPQMTNADWIGTIGSIESSEDLAITTSHRI